MEFRTLDVADLDAVFALRMRAFGIQDRDAWLRNARPAAERGEIVGAYEGGRVLASGRIIPFEQWWHGCAVPMAGVASVYVAPEERGRGLGSGLAAELLNRMDGFPLSVLFPATSPVYRSAGYEHAGAQHVITIPAEALRTLRPAGQVKIRAAGPDDAAEIVGLLRRLHAEARDCGPIDRGEAYVRGVLADPGVFAYLADDGFLAYTWAPGNAALDVYLCVAGSAETARALWSLVGSGSSVARTVSARVAPHDPVLWLLRDRSAEDIRRVMWMLRVRDAEQAVAARGFPAGVTIDVPLTVTDEQRPGNAGAWRLSVDGGAGRLTRATEDPAAVRLSARGLAALYGGIPMATLRRGDLAGGPTAGDASLDAAFSTTPYMLDYF